MTRASTIVRNAATIGISLSFLLAAMASAQEKDLRIYEDRDGKKSPLARKVVVTTEGVTYHAIGPDAPSEPVSALAVFHQLKTDDGKPYLDRGANRFLRVGKSDGVPTGWLKVKKPADPREEPSPSVAVWNTRYLLDPLKPESGKESFTIYTDAACKDTLAVLESVPDGQLAIAPVLRAVGNPRDRIYEVAFFTASVKSAASARAKPHKLEDLKIEIVFVVDSTSSMTPMLEATKEVIRRCAKEMKHYPRLEGRLRFGLVEYQDRSPGLVPSRLVSPLTDELEALQKKLAPLKVAPIGSEDTPEDVLAGLVTAIDRGGWSENSAKHIILIGDASAHLSGPKNTTGLTIAQVIEKARKGPGSASEQARVTKYLHAVRVVGEDMNDHALCSRQFREIAGNNGEFEGMYLVVDPRVEKEKNETIKIVTNTIMSAVEKLDLLKPPDGDDLKALRTSNPVAASFYRFIRSSGGKPQPLQFGYASTLSRGGNEVARLRMLVEREELNRFRAVLDLVETQLKSREDPDRRRDVKNLLQVLKQAEASLCTGGTVQVEDLELEALIQALPYRPRFLSTSAKALAQMTVAEYREWLGGLKKTREIIAAMLDRENDWLEISSGITTERYTYVRVTDLP